MPACARDSLLPKKSLVYSDVAVVCCSRTLSFRHVDNPTGTRMRRQWPASLSAAPYWVDWTVLVNHAPTRELVIYSEVMMSCFNHSLTDSLTLSTQKLWQVAHASSARSRNSLVPLFLVVREYPNEGLSPSITLTGILFFFLCRPELDPCTPDPQPNNTQTKCPYHYTLTAKIIKP